MPENVLPTVLADADGQVAGEQIAPPLGLTAGGAGFTNVLPDVIAITNTDANVTDTSSTVIAANTSRKTLEFFNADLSETIFLNFEGVAATVNDWPLLPQAYYTPPLITQGAVTGINGTAAATASLRINEGV